MRTQKNKKFIEIGDSLISVDIAISSIVISMSVGFWIGIFAFA